MVYLANMDLQPTAAVRSWAGAAEIGRWADNNGDCRWTATEIKWGQPLHRLRV